MINTPYHYDRKYIAIIILINVYQPYEFSRIQLRCVFMIGLMVQSQMIEVADNRMSQMDEFKQTEEVYKITVFF